MATSSHYCCLSRAALGANIKQSYLYTTLAYAYAATKSYALRLTSLRQYVPDRWPMQLSMYVLVLPKCYLEAFACTPGWTRTLALEQG